MTSRIILLVSISAVAATVVIGQTGGSAVNPSAPHEVGPFQNTWMAIPASAHPGSVAPDIRAQRDNFLDSLIGEPHPLTPQSANRAGIIQGSSFASSPEVPAITNRKIVLATLGTRIPVLTASQRAIYTEVTLSFLDILDKNVAPVAHVGDAATLILPGGSIIEDDGSVLSFLTQPRKLYVGPARTFLLVLGYHPNGDFYMMAKAWDISSGTAQPSFGIHPLSESITGLTVAQLSNELKAMLGN